MILLSVANEATRPAGPLLARAQGEPGRALETFFDLLAYATGRGKALPDGDTVGRSETERLPVHYVRQLD